MSIEENKALVRRYIEAMSGHAAAEEHKRAHPPSL